ncbi:MAG: nitrous oxide reductase accessory protein NosL, partial [Deltaproteobacteria bacterium]|nr:nitrous oxide reductase accessory protein NosL [Deltaproteobacteria bacterium]
GSADLPDGSKLDLSTTCPICNMKLEASNFGPAAIVLKDGKVVGFDGAGDLFRYLLSPEKQTIKTADIKAIYVTEYGTRNFVDARTAYYVVGTNVTGDMGPEVVPFSKKEAAEQFKSEQNGKRVVAFLDVTLDDLKSGKKLLKMRHGH